MNIWQLQWIVAIISQHKCVVRNPLELQVNANPPQQDGNTNPIQWTANTNPLQWNVNKTHYNELWIQTPNWCVDTNLPEWKVGIKPLQWNADANPTIRHFKRNRNRINTPADGAVDTQRKEHTRRRQRRRDREGEIEISEVIYHKCADKTCLDIRCPNIQPFPADTRRLRFIRSLWQMVAPSLTWRPLEKSFLKAARRIRK